MGKEPTRDNREGPATQAARPLVAPRAERVAEGARGKPFTRDNREGLSLRGGTGSLRGEGIVGHAPPQDGHEPMFIGGGAPKGHE